MVVVERSVSFKKGESERMMPIIDSPLEKEKDASTQSDSINSKEMNNQSLNLDNHSAEMTRKLGIFDPSSPKHQAAVKLQKVYKSYLTRRILADCAVVLEQRRWELLDFAELKWISISFFDMKKHHAVIYRWSRAKRRAGRVGKGLSNDENAQKLVDMHWLEAVDPRHRCGHNLHFYYERWLETKIRQPFFYWLDIGEGEEENLKACPRSKFQKQCIKQKRKVYEIVIKEGKLLYKKTEELIHTTADANYIFVYDTSKTLCVGKKKKGTFQHSSFLAGGVSTAAGRIIVENGILKAVSRRSGHYQPTEEKLQYFLSFLRENKVDLTDVKTSTLDELDSMLCK